jgi:short-subunit dehydrogenase
MARDLDQAVVVITGASSGIGRGTALEFARRGARLVLAARREAPLESLVAECRVHGADAIAVPTDTADEQAVLDLAQAAIDRFRRLDVWVNNASVTAIGRFEDTPLETARRLMDVNFWGYVHGARAALRHFRRQGSGVLINNDSLFGMVTSPYWSYYSASKWAVRGLTDTLRQETRGADIHVCAVLPASIDTPLWQHAANYSGRAIKAVNPTYDAMKVARTIVRLAERPRRELVVGNAGRMQGFLHALSPRLFDWMANRQMEADQVQEAAATRTQGNVFEPMAQGTTVDGGWRSGAAFQTQAPPAQPATGQAGRRREPGALGIAGAAALLVPLAATLAIVVARAGAGRAR